MDLTNPIKAIRAKCLDCCCNRKNEVNQCPHADCPLFPFRLGDNPYKAKRNLTPEQRAAMRERMQQINIAKMHDKQTRENRGTPMGSHYTTIHRKAGIRAQEPSYKASEGH